MFFIHLGLSVIRQAPYTVNRGDSFISKFWFNSENGTKFGIGSYEQMNKAILLYYPAKKLFSLAPWGCTYDVFLSACNASMTSRVLTSSQDIERVFGKAPAMCYEKTAIDGQAPNTTSPSSGMNHFEAFYHRYFTFVIAVIIMLVALCW